MVRERLAKNNLRFGKLAGVSAIEAMSSDRFRHHEDRNEACRRSFGNSGVDSSGVFKIAAAHESVLRYYVGRQLTIRRDS